MIWKIVVVTNTRLKKYKITCLKENRQIEKMVLDDFIRYAKEQFDCEISVKKCDKPDTFDSIFGASFLNDKVRKEKQMTIDELQLEAFRLIRKEARRFNRETNDSELGNYVKGVVDLETEIYAQLLKSNENEKSE